MVCLLWGIVVLLIIVLIVVLLWYDVIDKDTAIAAGISTLLAYYVGNDASHNINNKLQRRSEAQAAASGLWEYPALNSANKSGAGEWDHYIYNAQYNATDGERERFNVQTWDIKVKSDDKYLYYYAPEQTGGKYRITHVDGVNVDENPYKALSVVINNISHLQSLPDVVAWFKVHTEWN